MSDTPRLIEFAFPLKQASRDSVHERKVSGLSMLHSPIMRRVVAVILLFAASAISLAADSFDTGRHPVPKEHPRLLGSRERLAQLARDRRGDYERVVRVARGGEADTHAKTISLGLVCAIENDRQLGRQAVEIALKTIRGPIRKGHETFGHDLARCALAYDLCYDSWTPEERAEFYRYMNATVDANVQSETHVFHNAWYGYKNWGIGMACYATFGENPRAEAILRDLEADYRQRAAPALQLAGAGGGWAEGYYVNYWSYEWLFFCEVARYCEGVDYYALAPAFYKNRAVASMFETYPGIGQYNTRRPIPMGDGGGRLFGGDRDKALSARRILVNRFRDDPAHQAVHAMNETTPRSGVGAYAYKDFLWRDPSVVKGDLDRFRLSHYSPGPGYVCARSTWQPDATYFFFKCGDRFTAHQHLDVGHFLIYRHEELAGDGGHYDAFGSVHDVNYHLRSIAHNTILVYDPEEKWPAIRAGKVTGNDGGQAHNWPHHNGGVADPQQWERERSLYEIGDITALEDRGGYLYLAADCSRAYSKTKLESFTRQIVYRRPGTFVIFDRVVATDAGYRKTWLLQAMTPPERKGSQLAVTSGKGRLFVQTLLPARADVKLVSGEDLYRYGGRSYPPSQNTGPAPECRVEVSPPAGARADFFLHVLTATDAAVESVAAAEVEETAAETVVRVGAMVVRLAKETPGGSIEIAGRREVLPAAVVMPGGE